jgi:hypothetical protein
MNIMAIHSKRTASFAKLIHKWVKKFSLKIGDNEDEPGELRKKLMQIFL